MNNDIKYLVSKNIKFIIIMLIVILVGIFGLSYAIKITDFDLIGVNIGTATIDVDITYDTPSEEKITSTGLMFPIDDDDVTYDSSDERILKSKFYVEGKSSNPDDTIYDVALHNLLMECELRTSYLKWRLYKNGDLLSEGNMSPEFDSLDDNRLVLTDIQEDLTTDKDEYVFMLWLSESCEGDITNCTKEMDQSQYLNKTISGEIKLELSTKSKKDIVRTSGELGSCKYIKTNVPTCNNLTYNGENQKLISSDEESNYELVNNIGKNATEYPVTIKLKPGYRWPNSSTDDKIVNCSINKRNVNIIAKNQIVSSSISFLNDISMVNIDNLANGHILNSINLVNNNNLIEPSNPVIVDSNNNNVTENYRVSFVNGNIIAKANPTLQSTSEDSILLIDGNVDYEYSVVPNDLNVSCRSSNENVATCSIDQNNKLVTVLPKKVGNVIITLETTETASYDAYSIPINVHVECSKTATEPEVRNLTYDGNSQRGVIVDGRNISGTGLSAVNAGSYVATVTPNEGYCWEDGGTSSKQYSWTMNKAASSCTITNNSSLDYPKNVSGTIQYTCTGDGSVSVTSSNTDIISVSGISTSSANLTASNAGSSTITVAMSEGNNYLGSSANTNISVSYSQYTVSFNKNGGSGGQLLNVTATYNSDMPTISTTKPKRDGYTFMGWYDDPDYTKGVQYYTDAGRSARTFDKESNTTLYAGWEANTYTITFDANGGTVGTTSKTVTYDSAVGELPVPTAPAGTDAVFIGWFDDSKTNHNNSYTYKNYPLYFYADNYSDIYNAFGYDETLLYNHYLQYGTNEGRMTSQYVASTPMTTASNTTLYAGWVYTWQKYSRNVLWDETLMATDVTQNVMTNTFTSWANDRNEFIEIIDSLPNGDTINWTLLPLEQQKQQMGSLHTAFVVGGYYPANSDTLKAENSSNKDRLNSSSKYAIIKKKSTFLYAKLTIDIYEISNVRISKGDAYYGYAYSVNPNGYPMNGNQGKYWYVK